MATEYSAEDLLEFLDHTAERGLMPAATAEALAVACRRILGILSDEARADVRRLDIPAVVKRFGIKRAKDFNPASLKVYGRRFQRAVDLFLQWRQDPAAFSVPTRSTAAARKRAKPAASKQEDEAMSQSRGVVPALPANGASGYQSSFPVRPGMVVTLQNIPADLSKAEAERLAQFVRMLAIE